MDKPVTVITGSRKGIGRFLAEQYASRGHAVVGCSRQECDWSANGYEHFRVDVRNEQEVCELISKVRSQYGRLDHLINNAGIASMNHVLLTPAATVGEILDTNFMGSFLFCREAAKVMQKRKFGRIVNFTTVAVPLNLAGEAAYVCSKAAVESLTRILARELAPFKITVNAVGPTPIETDLVRSVPREKLDSLLRRQAIGRFGQMGDVLNVVDFFLRQESEFVTGQVLYLGGV